MTLLQINYIITISQCGSFNKAAEKLFLSQPSLTNAVKELEKELGIIIFNRSGRGVSLTAEGERFLPYARQVYAQYETLLEAYGKAGARREQFAVSTQHYSFAVKAFVEMARSVDVARYEFAIRETRTREVIDDVAGLRSEIGIIYLSEFNRKALMRVIEDSGLTFTHLTDCGAYVYLWRRHPLAGKAGITFGDLAPYPCLQFEQGGNNFFFAEEIMSTSAYPRVIKACDRATMLNLMVGLNGYTLCSGIICAELNGDDYAAVPYVGEHGAENVMEIGYLTRKGALLSAMGERYLIEIKRYLDTVTA